MERAHRVNTILFDKTGTLTCGELTVNSFIMANEKQKTKSGKKNKSANKERDSVVRSDILRCVLAAESASEHPLGRCLAQFAADELKKIKGEEGNEFDDGIDEVEVVAGHGLYARFKGALSTPVDNDMHEVHIGNRAMMQRDSIEINDNIESSMQSIEEEGQTAVVVAIDKKVAAIIGIGDTVCLLFVLLSSGFYISQIMLNSYIFCIL